MRMCVCIQMMLEQQKNLQQDQDRNRDQQDLSWRPAPTSSSASLSLSFFWSPWSSTFRATLSTNEVHFIHLFGPFLPFGIGRDTFLSDTFVDVTWLSPTSFPSRCHPVSSLSDDATWHRPFHVVILWRGAIKNESRSKKSCAMSTSQIWVNVHHQ